jgi:uncharacterized membrane protein YphA (DoxX/SURF4 family)
VVRVQIQLRAAPGAKWPTKLVAALAGLGALTVMLFVVLGLWIAVVAVVLAATGYGLVRALFGRHRARGWHLRSADADLSINKVGRTFATTRPSHKNPEMRITRAQERSTSKNH